MSPTTVLGEKDPNAALAASSDFSSMAATSIAGGGGDVKSMEYHRQVLQSKMEAQTTKQYISPSDNIMSPCTAKLKALRNKQVNKVKPKSLFAQASAKKMEGAAAAAAAGEGLFGAKNPDASFLSK